MASQIITVVPREGAKPRSLHVDDAVHPDGSEIRGGASLIATLKRQAARGELFSVKVEPLLAPEQAEQSEDTKPPRRVKKSTDPVEAAAEQ